MPEDKLPDTELSLSLRTTAMPADTNPNGDIFGGWLMSQMDIAAGIFSGQQHEGRFATVAVEKITFIKPVFVGDQVSCYCKLLSVGSTSIVLKVETWVRRFRGRNTEKVADGQFVFVAIDEDRKPVEHGIKP